MKSLSIMFVILFISVGCETYTYDSPTYSGSSGSSSGSSSGASSGPTSFASVMFANRFVDMLNDSAGVGTDDSYVVKNGTEQADYIVVYDDLLEEYVAYSLEYYHTWDDWDDYQDDLDRYHVDTFIVRKSGTDIYGNQAWVGNAGYGDVYFEDSTASATKDLEKLAAFKEQFAASKVSGYLASNFGLSDDRAYEVALMANEWDRLKASKGLTDADANMFSNDLLGVEIGDVNDAVKGQIEGDGEKMELLIEEAAEKNKISSEHMKNLIEGMFN